jgi:hypothetical protein
MDLDWSVVSREPGLGVRDRYRRCAADSTHVPVVVGVWIDENIRGILHSACSISTLSSPSGADNSQTRKQAESHNFFPCDHSCHQLWSFTAALPINHSHELARVIRIIPGFLQKVRQGVPHISILIEHRPPSPGLKNKRDIVIVRVLCPEQGDPRWTANGYGREKILVVDSLVDEVFLDQGKISLL